MQTPVGWATGELGDSADRACADRILQAVCEYGRRNPALDWDGKHSCHDDQPDTPWYFLTLYLKKQATGHFIRELVRQAAPRLRELTIGPSSNLAGVSTDLIHLRLELLKEEHCKAVHLDPGQRFSPKLDGSEASYCPFYQPPTDEAAHRGVALPMEEVEPRLFDRRDVALLKRVCHLVYNMHPQLGHVTVDLDTQKNPGACSYGLFFNGIDELRYSFVEHLAKDLGERLLNLCYRCEGAATRELRIDLLSEASVSGVSVIDWPTRKVLSLLLRVRKEAGQRGGKAQAPQAESKDEELRAREEMGAEARLQRRKAHRGQGLWNAIFGLVRRAPEE